MAISTLEFGEETTNMAAPKNTLIISFPELQTSSADAWDASAYMIESQPATWNTQNYEIGQSGVMTSDSEDFGFGDTLLQEIEGNSSSNELLRPATMSYSSNLGPEILFTVKSTEPSAYEDITIPILAF